MASPTGPTNVGVAPNVGGLLCYAPCCIGLLFSIAVAVVEKQSRFLRFHAFQSLLFHAAMLVVNIVLAIVINVAAAVVSVLGLLGIFVNIAVGLVMLAASIFLMMKAYNGEEYELPTLGQLARQWV